MDLLRDAWALLMPVECAGCAEPGIALCEECAPHLIPLPTPRTTREELVVVTALRFESRARAIIVFFKEHDRTDVAPQLAAALEAALIRAHARFGDAELVTVPTSRAAHRRRGYEPMVLLLHTLGRKPSRVLKMTRRTPAQKTLGAAQRRANRRGAFVARTSLDGRTFVIVDDILTTGSSLDAAAKALRDAGAVVRGGVTLAFTPRLLAFRDRTYGEDYGGAKGAR
ncbi:ComF family protein [soil metagenome]